MPIVLAITLEFSPFPGDQKLKDSVKSLSDEIELSADKLPEVENFGTGVAASASIAPTLVAGMATVVTFKDGNLTVVMFFIFAFFGLIYMRHLGRPIQKLTDKIPRPHFLLKRNPNKGAWNVTWTQAISVQNLTVDFILLGLVVSHHIM